MTNKFAVIGLGLFGKSIAKSLANKGAEILAIDHDIHEVESIKDDVAYAVALDATDIKAIKAQNITDFDAVVVAIGENFEGLLMTTVLLTELGVKRVIARAANERQRIILEKLGVKEILSPEGTIGESVAEMLLNPDLKSYLKLPDTYQIIEVTLPTSLIGARVREIKLRENYNINLITVKRKFVEVKDGEEVEVDHVIGVPKPDSELLKGDQLLLMGKEIDFEKFFDVNK